MYIGISTLILLAKAGLLDTMLKHAKETPKITERIRTECTVKKERFDAKLIEQRVAAGKIEVVEAPQKEAAGKIAQDFGLDLAEAEAIALSAKHKSVLVTDDKKAIQACKVLGIEYTTALNILVELYRKNRLKREEAVVALNKLKEHGRYSAMFVQPAEEELK